MLYSGDAQTRQDLVLQNGIKAYIYTRVEGTATLSPQCPCACSNLDILEHGVWTEETKETER